MNPRKIPKLSKSRFVGGLHCPLWLWHTCYSPDLAADVSPVQQAIFDTGHEVGRLATRLYPGGVLIEEDHLHHEEAMKSTLAALKDPSVPAIFEAAFLQDDVRIRADILERLDDGRWNLIEVKSSTSVKDYYLPDVAVQRHVLKGSGLEINAAGIMHLNNQYIFDGKDLDLESLFSFFDLTGEVLDLQDEIPSQIAELKKMLAGTVPSEIAPSRACNRPYGCELWEFCTAKKPEFWVMQLSGITQKKLDQLDEQGIEDIRDVPGSFPLSGIQERIRDCVASGTDFIAPEITGELMGVQYPVHFLDFETVSPAIPRYAGTRPYQTIPFQWSDHILSKNGTIEHREYLCEADKDPREEFAGTLLEALRKRGTIFVYTNYEKRIIEGLAEIFPQYHAELLAVLDRFKDLHALVKKHVYYPEFHGSFSLKSVLPVLVPSMTYDDLAIQDGNLASIEYLRMLHPDIPGEEREKIKESLLEYCGNDTLGMVKIREELLKFLS
jgi:predicted RecB family nuclease